MGKDQQECGCACMTVCDVHFVQTAKVFLGPLRAGGEEKRASHQHNIVRANNLTCVPSQEVGLSIVNRWKNQPDNDV
jgi:hypothetical protein